MEFDTVSADTVAEFEEKYQRAKAAALEKGELGVKAFKNMVLRQAGTTDTPLGFAAYFEKMSGMKLTIEAARWIVNAYKAHDEGRGLLQECHREAGKTTVISKFFLSFRIGHEPYKTWAIVRINEPKARQTAKAIARIIEYDPTWKEYFPNIVPYKERGWGDVTGYYVKDTSMSEEQWEKVNTASVDDPTFIGYGWSSGSVIGSRWTGGAIIDDIVDADSVSSDAESAKLKTFVTSTLSFCLTEGAWEFWNFTPWTKTDIYANRKATGNYAHNKSPCLIPAKEGETMVVDTGEIYGKVELEAEYWEPAPLNPDYPEYGQIPLSGRWYFRYWADAWSWERLENKYRDGVTEEGSGGHIEFARMLMLDLDAIEGLTLKSQWLHYFPAEDIDPSWAVFFGIDYASTRDKLKRGKERDYFSLAVLRAVPLGGLVLVDGYRGRLTKGEALLKTAGYFNQYPTCKLITVESIGKGEEFYNDLVMMDDAYGIPLPLLEIPSHGRKSKGSRFEDWLAPKFQVARIWVSNAFTPWLQEFKNEWLSYPNGAFDDCLDAVYMAAQGAQGYMPIKTDREGRKKKQPHPMQQICAHRAQQLEMRQ